MHVLIVHPNRIIQIALSHLVSSFADFRVTVTMNNCAQTMDYLAHSEERIDLILIDPSSIASGALTRLIAMTAAKIMLITNDDSMVEIDGWVREGARGILGPSADIEQFEKALQKVCQGEYWLNRDLTSRILSSLSHAQELTPEQNLIAQLTAKEKLVIQAVVNGGGQTLRETALKLNISENTVRNHLTSIYSKLGIANRLELFVFAQRFMAG